MRGRRVLVGTLLLSFLSCGDDDHKRQNGTLSLDDGTRVEVRDNGGLTLVVDGRATFATSDRAGPRVHRFTEVAQSFAGLWNFGRVDEGLVAIDVFETVRQSNGDVQLQFAAADGSARGTLTVATRQAEESTVLRFEVETTDPPTSLALPVRCDSDGGFFGFGEQYNTTDQRGEAFTLFVSEQGIGREPGEPVLPANGGVHTTYFPMPYYLDPRGFGVLVRTARRVDVDLCRSDPDIAWIEVVSGEPLELLVFHGPTPLDVIRQLGDEIGRPQQPPAWAYELWIGAQGGTEAIRAEAAALRAAEIPAHVLWVQDWTGVRPNLTGGFGVQYRWTADESHYPDLAGLIADLKAQGFRFLAYANPFVARNLGHFPEMMAAGTLIHRSTGSPYVHFAPSGPASHPDLTNPDARDYVKGFLRTMVRDLGMDGWMADFGEWLPLDAVYFDGSDPMAAHNRYPEAWMRLSREVMDELRPDGDWVVFSRSGFTGMHAVSMIHWTGDQETSFSPYDGLPTVVPAMLNLGISGIPIVTHDIAGFSSVTVPPSSKELFLRWTELGAFTPIMRTHEGDRGQENWSWETDAETTAHFRRFARVHAALGPDFQALAAEAARTSAPIVRHLMLVFPDDARSRQVSDQFMIGESLLVAPVLQQGAAARTVYLPPGTWYHVWSGERFAGGVTIEVDAPIGSPPVFSRDSDRPELRTIS